MYLCIFMYVNVFIYIMYIHKYMGMPVFVFTYTYICIKQDSWGITVETAFSPIALLKVSF